MLPLAFAKASTAIAGSELERLRASLKGQLLLPTDPDYDAARRVESFNPTTDRHPQMIVRCLEPQDVIRSIAFAHDKALEVAVRSGGHDLLGASVCDGIVIDLSRMKDIGVDRDRGTVHVSAGVRAGELNASTLRSGLAAVLGCSPGVGVAGLTLGGGLGWFLGKHGTAADNLRGADLITADGKMLRVTAAQHKDLFWALKGGGGNFGIVTGLDLQLYPVDQVVGGVVAYRMEMAQFLRFYRDFMEIAPDALTVELNILLTKPSLIAALVCWSGDPAERKRVLGPLEALGPPIANNIDVVPYSHLGERFGLIGQLLKQASPPAPSPPVHTQPPGPVISPAYNYWRGGSLEALTNEAIDQIQTCADSAPDHSSIGVGHYMHGQACRSGVDDSPITRRSGQITYFFSASWIDAAIAETHLQWVNRSNAAMRPLSSKSTYINYLSSDDEQDVRASYEHSYDRLARIKRRYDPGNFFHRNRNIRPA
jgi:FAD/FMN-containing dehydrogenase